MEEWKEVFKGIIPTGDYQTQIINGEDKGLVIKLISSNNHIVLKFGMICAMRVLDEGIVQKEIYPEHIIKMLKKDDFKNVIYEVYDGGFLIEIKNMSDGYLEILNVKHYVIITQNYNIDIITEWEPEIRVY